ncbi:paraquat-inducible protein A [Thermodesulfobacteriota bacterium]
MHDNTLMACHECDLLHRIVGLPEGGTARCRRCGAVLVSHKRNSLDRSLSLTITGLILFVMANAYPLLEIKSGSLYQATTIIGSVEVLFRAGMWQIGCLVFLTAFFLPFLDLMSRLYILIPLKMNKKAWKLSFILSLIQSINPWGMMEVFMLGVLVSVVKLVKMMKVIPGISLFALVLLIFVLAWIAASFDTHMAWEKVEGES